MLLSLPYYSNMSQSVYHKMAKKAPNTMDRMLTQPTKVADILATLKQGMVQKIDPCSASLCTVVFWCRLPKKKALAPKGQSNPHLLEFEVWLLAALPLPQCWPSVTAPVPTCLMSIVFDLWRNNPTKISFNRQNIPYLTYSLFTISRPINREQPVHDYLGVTWIPPK